ncbi:MAG: DUF616 domain-containing protein [Paludibacteraceae bacterium]|nr:DUF616 domain-containing protein [Paludibacteraceae bacterium]
MLAIYTVITGNYDEIHQPQVVMPGAGYFLFTNNAGIADLCDTNNLYRWRPTDGCRFCGNIGVWNVILLDTETEIEISQNFNLCKNLHSDTDLSNIKNIILSRKIKMLPHKYIDNKYDTSIYIDADMLITGDFTELIKNLDNNISMAAFMHSYCHSVREEIDDLIGSGVVDKDMAEKQWQRYVEWGFKDDMGITENGCLIRKHNETHVVELMELWWNEFKNGCQRDQVSLMPCIHRVKFGGLKILDGNIHNNKWIKICKHKK